MKFNRIWLALKKVLLKNFTLLTQFFYYRIIKTSKILLKKIKEEDNKICIMEDLKKAILKQVLIGENYYIKTVR